MATSCAPTSPASPADHVLVDELPGTLPEAVATWLEHLGDLTGDRAYRRAASALRGRVPGRHEIAGTADRLAEMAFLIENGAARTAEEAARLIVISMPPPERKAATIDRLARKFRLGKAPG